MYLRGRMLLIAALAAHLGCIQEPKDDPPPELVKVMEDIAANDPATEHRIVCGATYDAIDQEVVVSVRTRIGHIQILDMAPPTNLTVKRFGRDITPSDFDRLEKEIARAIDDRAGRSIVEEVKIMEVHYKRMITERLRK